MIYDCEFRITGAGHVDAGVGEVHLVVLVKRKVRGAGEISLPRRRKEMFMTKVTRQLANAVTSGILPGQEEGGRRPSGYSAMSVEHGGTASALNYELQTTGWTSGSVLLVLL